MIETDELTIKNLFTRATALDIAAAGMQPDASGAAARRKFAEALRAVACVAIHREEHLGEPLILDVERESQRIGDYFKPHRLEFKARALLRVTTPLVDQAVELDHDAFVVLTLSDMYLNHGGLGADIEACLTNATLQACWWNQQHGCPVCHEQLQIAAVQQQALKERMREQAASGNEVQRRLREKVSDECGRLQGLLELELADAAAWPMRRAELESGLARIVALNDEKSIARGLEWLTAATEPATKPAKPQP